jgi:transposase/ribosomal protein L34
VMTGGARVIGPDRAQLRWEMTDLDSQLAQDHRARVVWAFVESLDLSSFYEAIRSRDSNPGRPAADPRVLLALWLYATLEGVGSARAIDRLCTTDTAYRWLCGGMPVNYHGLADFRVEHGDLLDKLLIQSLTGLIAEGLVKLDEIAIDGTKVKASAGRGSYARGKRLVHLEREVGERVATLKAELESDSAAGERRRKSASLAKAQELARRIAGAKKKVEALEAERKQAAKKHAKDAEKKKEPRASTTDPEARYMRFADKATGPGYNLAVATACDFVIAIDATDRRNDAGLAAPLIERIVASTGRGPERLLLDTGCVVQDDVIDFEKRWPNMTVYAPPQPDKQTIKPASLRKREIQRSKEPQVLKNWRARMNSEEGQSVYARRKHTERAHGRMKNRGLEQLPVRGLVKVRCVALLHALADTLLRAHNLRRAQLA